MRKFSKLVEDIKGGKSFKIIAQVELIVEASNEGEASYIADSSLSSLKNQSNYTISKVEETDDNLSDK